MDCCNADCYSIAFDLYRLIYTSACARVCVVLTDKVAGTFLIYGYTFLLGGGGQAMNSLALVLSLLIFCLVINCSLMY